MADQKDLSFQEWEEEHQRQVDLFNQSQPDIESLMIYLPEEEFWGLVWQGVKAEFDEADILGDPSAVSQSVLGIQNQMETRFSVLTYNILHPDWAKPDRYPNLPSTILEWSHRLPVILAQLRESKADIICLQEVDASSIHADLCVPLAESGYSGFWQQTKSRLKALRKWNGEAKSKPNTMVCATFVRNDTFRCVGQVSGSRHLTLALCLLDDDPQRVMTITNVHLESIQVLGALQLHETHIRKLGPEVDLVCGDFNEDISGLFSSGRI